MSTVQTDKGELLLSNKVNDNPDPRVIWHKNGFPGNMKRTLCVESLPVDSFPLFRLLHCWNRLFPSHAQTQVTSDSPTGSCSSLSGHADLRELGTAVFSTVFISCFHAVEMILAVSLTVIPHPFVPMLFWNMALLAFRCVISKDLFLGRLCKWSLKLQSSNASDSVQNQCSVKTNIIF